MMTDKAHCKKIMGMSVCNPVDVAKDYLLYAVEYAGRLGFNHLQVIGPIHDGVKGNIDGMTPYRKYSRFNDEKNLSYMEQTIDAVTEACDKAKQYGIKMYQWHHELDLPAEFKAVFPETVNSYGDIEVTHPLVKDFLENKIIDFFYTYPGMDGIILTLHETKIPLLKLKDQKLGKIERVKYVTEILYNTCRALGKELIVRPFASIEEDYVMMTKAYEEISTALLIMDKWTQFDWSLTMPSNAFYHKIKNNPLLVEADIFGEFFGKGHVPLMLKKHLAEKFAYCEDFLPAGYVARIDRGGQIPFGDVNEVNIIILNAYLSHKDVDAEIERFFREKYLAAAEDVRSMMEQTEAVLTKTIYTRGYYFTELSRFPTLNHCKNHFYFEMMRKNYAIASEEWFIPKGWQRGSLKEMLAEKEDAVCKAEELYRCLELLEGKMDAEEYQKLWVKFTNLRLVTKLWCTLTATFMDYVRYFECGDEKAAISFQKNVELLLELKQEGIALLGDAFYCLNCGVKLHDYVEDFANEIRECFRLEKAAVEKLQKDEKIVDYVICGGAMEGHRLQKEVNFSDTLVVDGKICRIPGNRMGMKWSNINAHGWFSYEVKVKPFSENTIKLLMGNPDGELHVRVSMDDETYDVREKIKGEKEVVLTYHEEHGEDTVRIRFDKISGYTPCVFEIKVYDAG